MCARDATRDPAVRDEVSTGARDALSTVGADLGEQANLLLVKVDVDDNTALKERFGITDEDDAPGRMLIAKKVAKVADVKYEKVTVEAGSPTSNFNFVRRFLF